MKHACDWQIAALQKQTADGTEEREDPVGLDLLGPVDPFSLPSNVEVMDDFYLLTQYIHSMFMWIS